MKLRKDANIKACRVAVGIANYWAYAAAQKSKDGNAIMGA